MTGLDAIQAHDGWAIALLGISIVFTGLILLSTTIAQLHKVLGLWENRAELLREMRARRAAGTISDVEDSCIIIPMNLHENARNFRLLADHLGEPFALPRLLDHGIRCGISRPHSALNDLIQKQIIVPNPDGFYRWNENARL